MNALVPMEQLSQMAQVLGKSKMFGKSAEDLLPLMLIASAEGKHPAIAAQEYDVIQGRPALNARSAQSRFQAAGGCVNWIKRSDTECSAEFSHPQGGKVVITWNMERAKQAKLNTKDNWIKFPAQMLSARVVAEGVRACFPACLSGFYLSEEVQDFDTPKTAPARNLSNVTIQGQAIEQSAVQPAVIEDAVIVEETNLEAELVIEALEYVAKKQDIEPLVMLDTLTKGKIKTYDLVRSSTDKVLARLKNLIEQELAKCQQPEEDTLDI